MKTILRLKKNVTQALLLNVLLTTALFSKAQTTVPELIFKNPVIESGTAGADGTVYRFANVATNVDALVTIAGRSSSLVKISNIDLSNTGYDNAFQPQISYNNGSASKNKDWWVDFNVNFVNKTTGAAVTVSAFNVTALDVDGDGGNLNEYVSFYSAQSYMLESNSLLTVKSLLNIVFDLLVPSPGKQFDAPKKGYNGVNVNATDVMTTLAYANKSSFRMRAGGATSNGSSSNTDRMYSLWFKGFNYNNPVQITLPVKLISFSAMLNTDMVDIKWVTASEKNVSHFTIEKSFDGSSYTDAGVVFAYGNTSETIKYSFTDKNIDIKNAGVIYYRLRSVDNDGTSELSEIRSIRIGKKAEQGISILTYPNPVSSELRVTIPSNWQGKKVTYELFNNKGQAVIKNTIAASSQTEALNANSLAPGFYIVKASCNGETAQQKIIKR